MGFFLIEYGRLYVGKSDCEYEQIIIYFCFIFPQAVCNFSFKCIHFSYGASLCAQLSYTSRAISPFLFISLWFRFVFSVVILQRYNVCFSYQVRAGAWLGIGAWPAGSKWEAIIWSAAVENEDHDDEGDYLDLKENDEYRLSRAIWIFKYIWNRVHLNKSLKRSLSSQTVIYLLITSHMIDLALLNVSS